MIKVCELVKRRPDLTVEQFQDYWRTTHGPIAARIPGLRRYEQNHVRLGAYRDGRRPEWDGLAITWFDSTDAMRAAATTDAYRHTRADEPNFIVARAVPTLLTKEFVVL